MSPATSAIVFLRDESDRLSGDGDDRWLAFRDDRSIDRSLI